MKKTIKATDGRLRALFGPAPAKMTPKVRRASMGPTTFISPLTAFPVVLQLKPCVAASMNMFHMIVKLMLS